MQVRHSEQKDSACVSVWWHPLTAKESLRREKWVPDGCGNWQETNAEADLEKTDWRHQRWKWGQGGPDKVDNTWYIIFGAFQGRMVRWTICSWIAVFWWWILSCGDSSAFCTGSKTKGSKYLFPCTWPSSFCLLCKDVEITQITHFKIAVVSIRCSLGLSAPIPCYAAYFFLN